MFNRILRFQMFSKVLIVRCTFLLRLQMDKSLSFVSKKRDMYNRQEKNRP